MKYKAIGIGVCLCGLAVSAVLLVLAAVLHGAAPTRYHQHLEAQEKAACTHGDDVFCTHLPLVMIDTGGLEIPGEAIVDEYARTVGYTTTEDGEDRIAARMTVVDHDQTNNHIDDEPTIETDIVVHVRGRSSRRFDKLGYALRLVTEDGQNNPLSLMGMDAHHEWVLHGPFLDKTLLRNYMWYNIAGEIMDYAPNVRFCEVYLNGEYQGVYVMVEQITAGVDSGRLDLSVSRKDNTFTGYLVQLDGEADVTDDAVEQLTAYTLRNDSWITIEYPGAANITDEMKEAIRQDFSAFEKALYSYDYSSPELGYERYIDVQSFIDYFILNEFSLNFDAGIRSTYIYKGVDQKLHMCVWDFNNIFDNYFEPVNHHLDFILIDRPWYFMLLKDEAFVEGVIDRYRSLRTSYLSDEYLMGYIDDVVEYLGPAIERNYERWGYSFEDEYDLKTPRSRNPRSYDEAIEDLKDSILEEGAWMDQNIEALRQYCAASNVKSFNVNTR